MKLQTSKCTKCGAPLNKLEIAREQKEGVVETHWLCDICLFAFYDETDIEKDF